MQQTDILITWAAAVGVICSIASVLDAFVHVSAVATLSFWLLCMSHCHATGVIIPLLTQLSLMHTFRPLSFCKVFATTGLGKLVQNVIMTPAAKSLGRHHCSDLSTLQLQNGGCFLYGKGHQL